MADALVAADLDLAADVGCDLAAEVTLDLEVALDVVAEGDELVVGQILDADVAGDPGVGEGLAAPACGRRRRCTSVRLPRACRAGCRRLLDVPCGFSCCCEWRSAAALLPGCPRCLRRRVRVYIRRPASYAVRVLVELPCHPG